MTKGLTGLVSHNSNMITPQEHNYEGGWTIYRTRESCRALKQEKKPLLIVIWITSPSTIFSQLPLLTAVPLPVLQLCMPILWKVPFTIFKTVHVQRLQRTLPLLCVHQKYTNPRSLTQSQYQSSPRNIIIMTRYFQVHVQHIVKLCHQPKDLHLVAIHLQKMTHIH